MSTTTEPAQTKGFVSFSYDVHPIIKFPGKRIAEIKISGLLYDPDPEFSLLGSVWTPTGSIISQIRKAAMEPGINAILLSIGDIRAGMATIEEIRKAVLEARLAGKKVVCHLDFVGMGEYYLASAASEIVLTPTAHWFTPGLGFEVMLFKGLFEKLGIKGDFVVAGRYKGFAEPYCADSLSAEFRENEMRILADWYDRMVERIAVSRDLTPERIDSVFQHASFRADEAKRLGLVDCTGYYSDLPKKIWGKKAKKISMKPRSLYRDNWKMEKKIAVIMLTGTIIPGNSFTDFLSGSRFAGSNTMVEIIRKARDDKMIGAIVLRLNSGGGSALASDIIWHEIEIARKKKPVIVSVGDVAASGAYYIACAADTIMANPGSVVGSIGVFGGKLVFQDLYKKIGLKTETIKVGEKADALSASRPFTQKEKDMLRNEIEAIYNTFRDRVAEGRSLDSTALDSVSEGRIFTGSQAKENGLVDLLGDLPEAIRLAKEKANIKVEEVQLEVFPKSPSLWVDLGKDRIEQARIQFQRITALLGRERIWAIAPWVLF